MYFGGHCGCDAKKITEWLEKWLVLSIDGLQMDFDTGAVVRNEIAAVRVRRRES